MNNESKYLKVLRGGYCCVCKKDFSEFPNEHDCIKRMLNPKTANLVGSNLGDIQGLPPKSEERKTECVHCGYIRESHGGHQAWCIETYHSENPKKFTPKSEEEKRCLTCEGLAHQPVYHKVAKPTKYRPDHLPDEDCDVSCTHTDEYEAWLNQEKKDFKELVGSKECEHSWNMDIKPGQECGYCLIKKAKPLECPLAKDDLCDNPEHRESYKKSLETPQKRDLSEALQALGNMWNQYCGTNGHLFMHAGESASEVLMKHKLLKDEWSEIDYDILDNLTSKEPPVVKENFTTPPSQEERKNSLRDVYIRCLNMPGKNLAFEDYIVPKVCQIREQAIEEGVDEGLSASKILWHRMEIWQNEWQAEKPKERALTHEDALRLIEWKINKAYYLGHLQGFRDTATRALKDMDADVKAIQTEALEAYKTSLRAKIEAMKLPTCSAKTGELCECPKNKFEHNACLDEVLKLLE